MCEACAGRAIKSFLVLRTLSQPGDAHMGEFAHVHKFPGSISQAHLIPRRRASLTNLCVFSAAEATVCTVTLEKTSAGLGFSLEGGKGSLHGDKPLTVNRIFKGVMWVPFWLQLQASEGPTGLISFPQPQALLRGRQTSYELDFAFLPLLLGSDIPVILLFCWVLVNDPACSDFSLAGMGPR